MQANAVMALPALGPYQLVQQIGQGGFATVFLATDEEARLRLSNSLPSAHSAARVTPQEKLQQKPWELCVARLRLHRACAGPQRRGQKIRR